MFARAQPSIALRGGRVCSPSHCAPPWLEALLPAHANATLPRQEEGRCGPKDQHQGRAKPLLPPPWQHACHRGGEAESSCRGRGHGASTNDAALVRGLLHCSKEELPSMANTSTTLPGRLRSCYQARHLALQCVGPPPWGPCLGSLHMGGALEEEMWVTRGGADIGC